MQDWQLRLLQEVGFPADLNQILGLVVHFVISPMDDEGFEARQGEIRGVICGVSFADYHDIDGGCQPQRQPLPALSLYLDTEPQTDYGLAPCLCYLRGAWVWRQEVRYNPYESAVENHPGHLSFKR